MDSVIGRFPAQIERPTPIRFGSPIVLVPELFTTQIHLAALSGFLANNGWEVYAPDFRAVASVEGRRALAECKWSGRIFEGVSAGVHGSDGFCRVGEVTADPQWED